MNGRKFDINNNKPPQNKLTTLPFKYFPIAHKKAHVWAPFFGFFFFGNKIK